MANEIWKLALRVAYKLMLAYWFIARPTERGVYVAVWCGDRILMIHNSYKPQATLPCGGLKRDEDPLEGAVREVREEVGVELRADQLAFVDDYVSRVEFKTDLSRVYEVRVDPEPEIRIDGREVISGEFVSYEEARRRDVHRIVRQYFDACDQRGGSPTETESASPEERLGEPQ
ncbi:MAG: NUDIX hydrolase [Planctomycetota bacterium]